jgi:hypothetical protein
VNQKMSLQDQTQKEKDPSILNEVPEQFIGEGEKLLAAYKGITLYGLSGQSTDEQALSRGHFGGKAAGIISLFVFLQELLNDLASLPPELIPVMEKTPQGKIWVTDETKALQLGKDYGYKIIQKGTWTLDEKGEPKEFIILPSEQDRYYFDYTGLAIRDNDIAMFAYNVARATGSFQGETKTKIGEALANLKAVPIFPQGIRTVQGELYGEQKDTDAD